MKNKTNGLARFAMAVLLTYQMWSWVFTQTVFRNEVINYVFFVLSAVLFGVLLYQSGPRIIVENSARVWLPSLIYIIFLTAIALYAEKIAWWFCCLSMLLISIRKEITSTIPLKLFLFCGVYSMVGIWVEMLFPSFYSNYVNPLFIFSENLERWGENYGFAGFTYQLGTSAIFILTFEAAWLYHYKDKVKIRFFWTVLIIAILSVFLTGKRALSLMAFLLPIIVYLFSQRRALNTIIKVIVLSIVGIVIVNVFISTSAKYGENVFLRRFSDTVTNAQSGADIESGRKDLRAMAIKAWKEHPMFGIGINNYKEYTHAGTEAHNAYLQVLCEQGIVGFTLWVIPLLFCIGYTYSALRRCSNNTNEKQWLKFSLFLQLQFIAYAFTGNPMSNAENFTMYFMSIAIVSEIRYRMFYQRVPVTQIT